MTYIAGKRGAGPTALHTELLNRLIQELKQTPLAEAPDSPVEPVVVEEQVPHSDVLHVYVRWERWREIEDDSERSAIILDAYEAARGKDVVDRIGVAMGVTRDEARRMGLALP